MISNKKRIGILYICTGKYNQFFDAFFHSCERFFLTSYEKSYYVWTDDDGIKTIDKRIVLFHKECQGFPFDSLFRFEMFLQAEEMLNKEDYLFFFNSNAEIRASIGEEFLPDESGLVAAKWPGKRLKQNPVFYPYERNKESLAYIPPFDPPYHYYMGGINGGTSKDYLRMIRILSDNIRKDFEKGIIAIVHDESHINAYLHTHPCKALSQEYCWPEEWSSSFSPLIVFRDKVRVDSSFNKGRNRSKWGRIKKGIRILYRAFIWFF